jgi:hypothetical protein
MRAEEFQELFNIRPFTPFTIFLTDGVVYEIRHPEQAVLTRSALHIKMTAVENNLRMTKLIRCALIHIVRVETLDPT